MTTFKNGLYTELLELRQHPELPVRGEGIRVAIIDTGISRKHPDMRGQVVKSLCFRAAKKGMHYKEYMVDNTGKNGHTDPTSHGTTVASVVAHAPRDVKINGQKYTISGVAPEAQLYDLRVVPDDSKKINFDPETALRGALQWCWDQPSELRPHIINLSFGGDMHPLDPKDFSKDLKDFTESERKSVYYYIKLLAREGVIIVTSMANDRVDIDEKLCIIKKNLYAFNQTPKDVAHNHHVLKSWSDHGNKETPPSNYPEVIVVGSVYKYENVYFKSHYNRVNELVDVFCPGQNVVTCLSPDYTGGLAEKNISMDSSAPYCLKVGNSYATPYLVGYIALVLSYLKKVKKLDQFPCLPMSDLLRLLRKYSRDGVCLVSAEIFDDPYWRRVPKAGADALAPAGKLPVPEYKTSRPAPAPTIYPAQWGGYLGMWRAPY